MYEIKYCHKRFTVVMHAQQGIFISSFLFGDTEVQLYGKKNRRENEKCMKFGEIIANPFFWLVIHFICIVSWNIVYTKATVKWNNNELIIINVITYWYADIRYAPRIVVHCSKSMWFMHTDLETIIIILIKNNYITYIN